MPMPTNIQVNDALRWAGLPFGIPTEGRYEDWVDDTPNQLRIVQGLFDNEILDQLATEAGLVDPASPPPGFTYFFAAAIVEFALSAGFTPTGRSLDLTGYQFGELNQQFAGDREAAGLLRSRVSFLRSLGRRASAQ